jgi:hypothetical protein
MVVLCLGLGFVLELREAKVVVIGQWWLAVLPWLRVWTLLLFCELE